MVTLLEDMKSELKSTKSNKIERLPELLLGLTAAVQTLVTNLKTVPVAAKERERVLEDELDDLRQRSLKGNLILSTTKGSNKILSEEQLIAKGSNAMEHAICLIEEKMEVKIPTSDVQDCHFLPGGSIILRCWNVSPKSAFKILVDRIKSGKGKKDIPLYINFQLTKRRATLLFHLRALKREGKISKFYSDEGGSVALRVRDGGPKVKLTTFSTDKNTPGAPLRTAKDRAEIMELAGLNAEDEGSWANM